MRCGWMSISHAALSVVMAVWRLGLLVRWPPTGHGFANLGQTVAALMGRLSIQCFIFDSCFCNPAKRKRLFLKKVPLSLCL
jgi:hypothetical protein